MNRDAVLRVVRASRRAMRLSKILEGLYVGKGDNLADEIFGDLSGALFNFIHEKLTPEQRFDTDSTTMRILTGDLNDEAAADAFIMFARIHEKLHAEPKEAEQPKPQTMTKEELETFFNQNRDHGYQPGGERK